MTRKLDRTQTRKGQSIEDASMQMIENEIGSHPYNEEQWPIVRRIIHATADFDFAKENAVVFHSDAIPSAKKALKNGCNIVVDVNGIVGLLNKQNLKDFDNKTVCKISDKDIMQKAKTQNNMTRAQISMREAALEMNGGVVVIGNSPTALTEVIQMIKEKAAKPALVVGTPVGFIGAAESKKQLQTVDIPFITNVGRKGGSPCASAIINALFKLIRENSG